MCNMCLLSLFDACVFYTVSKMTVLQIRQIYHDISYRVAYDTMVPAYGIWYFDKLVVEYQEDDVKFATIIQVTHAVYLLCFSRYLASRQTFIYDKFCDLQKNIKKSVCIRKDKILHSLHYHASQM